MQSLFSLFPAEEFSLLGIVIGLPLLGAIVNGIWGKRLGKDAVRLMALSVMGLSFVAALVTFFALCHQIDLSKSLETINGHQVVKHEHEKLSWLAWNWMYVNGKAGAGTIPIDVKFSVDALSGIMMLVITGVGSLIHLYASKYMEADKAYWRFFAYLNLFVFSMLILVLADNLPLLFVGWEGVGVCSYLLIGFWFDKDANAAAGKKAFIANRIGDFGLLCGMFLLAHYVGALDFAGIEAGVKNLLSTDFVHVWPIGGDRLQPWLSFLQPSTPVVMTGATAVALCLFIGATGKSAQLPLYVWLPDAMAGPTPVSALIHAATMVTAGVYLLCRTSSIFVLSPAIMALVAGIGAATALLAATIALVQTDLKKVLAYSTVSQLGFMFLGVGSGAFVAGFFHVLTHAFFKACLFLAAGSVIHAMHARVHDDEKSQDMRMMGGLKKHMPITFITFAVATAAIIGFPFTSGFFSKDEILLNALSNSYQFANEGAAKALHMAMPPAWLGKVYFAMGVLAATLTAFYMCRALFLTFYGEFKGWAIDPNAKPAHGHDDHADHGDHHHEEDLSVPGLAPHESPLQMTIPLIVLAALAAFAGFMNPGFLKLFWHDAPMALEHWLEPVVGHAVEAGIKIPEHMTALEWTATLCAFTAFASGSAVAYWTYILNDGKPAAAWAASMPKLHNLLMNKWKVDELYENTAIATVEGFADTSMTVDRSVDFVLAKLTSFLAGAFGTALRAAQTGVVHVYAAVMALGMLAVVAFFSMPHAAATVLAKPNGDFVLEASPGPGYSYAWGDGDDKFGSVTTHTESLKPGETKTVKLRVQNSMGLMTSTEVFELSRPAAEQPAKSTPVHMD